MFVKTLVWEVLLGSQSLYFDSGGRALDWTLNTHHIPFSIITYIFGRHFS